MKRLIFMVLVLFVLGLTVNAFAGVDKKTLQDRIALYENRLNNAISQRDNAIVAIQQLRGAIFTLKELVADIEAEEKAEEKANEEKEETADEVNEESDNSD